jgi:hypothetical protein
MHIGTVSSRMPAWGSEDQRGDVEMRGWRLGVPGMRDRGKYILAK